MTTITNGSLIQVDVSLVPLFQGYPINFGNLKLRIKKPMVYLGEKTFEHYWVTKGYFFLFGERKTIKSLEYDSKEIFLVTAQRPFTTFLFLAEKEILSLEKDFSTSIKVLLSGYEEIE